MKSNFKNLGVRLVAKHCGDGSLVPATHTFAGASLELVPYIKTFITDTQTIDAGNSCKPGLHQNISHQQPIQCYSTILTFTSYNETSSPYNKAMTYNNSSNTILRSCNAQAHSQHYLLTSKHHTSTLMQSPAIFVSLVPSWQQIASTALRDAATLCVLLRQFN